MRLPKFQTGVFHNELNDSRQKAAHTVEPPCIREIPSGAGQLYPENRYPFDRGNLCEIIDFYPGTQVCAPSILGLKSVRPERSVYFKSMIGTLHLNLSRLFPAGQLQLQQVTGFGIIFA